MSARASTAPSPRPRAPNASLSHPASQCRPCRLVCVCVPSSSACGKVIDGFCPVCARLGACECEKRPRSATMRPAPSLILRASLLLCMTHSATCTTDDATCAASDLPSQWAEAALEPQGLHTLADVGSSPMISTKLFPQGNTLGTGIWECTPGSWHITRTTTESFLVLSGRAKLTEADGSERVTLVPGLWHTSGRPRVRTRNLIILVSVCTNAASLCLR